VTGRWFNIYLFLKGAVVGWWRILKFLSSASDEWSGSLPMSAQEFPHSPSPQPQLRLPLPLHPQPQPRLHPSGSSSGGGAVQNCNIFIWRGGGCTFWPYLFFSGGAVDPGTYGIYIMVVADPMYVLCTLFVHVRRSVKGFVFLSVSESLVT